MKKIYSAVTDSENALADLLKVGSYYDYEVIGSRSANGCQVFKGFNSEGELTFWNQFAHDGFGGLDTVKPSSILRVWE